MKKYVLILVLAVVSGLGFAVAKKFTEDAGVNPPKVEIAKLEKQVSEAKQAGQAVDPGLSSRIRELVPQVSGHPGQIKAEATGYSTAEMLSTPDGAVWVNTNLDLSPLEQEISRLEWELTGGLSSQQPDEITRMNLKDRLNELYSRRPENRERNPLDQGNDICPATVITGVPYYDSGTTVGDSNNFVPITPCNTSLAPDVIYQFTPLAGGSYTISLCGSSYDTYLYVNTTGICPGTIQVACNDDFCGLQSQVTVNMTVGTTYFIIVDGFNTASGNYTLALTRACEVVCQPTDILECAGEAIDSSNARLDCDGGCNNDDYGGVNTFGSIAPFQTVCGRAFTYTGPSGIVFRDTDWYRFTLAEDCSVKVILWSEFAAKCQILSDDNCATTNVLHIFTTNILCDATVSQTTCLPAGDYILWVGPNNFTGLNGLANYRARLDILPCSGCRIDASITAPSSGGWHTCVGGNDCAVRPSQDFNYCVNIPYEGDWTFTVCNDDSIWDSYIYLMSTCCGSVIAENDDGCGGVGLSVISCEHLTAGTYYLLVEGFSSGSCGPFNLRVEECLGACCYGTPANPSCAFISQADCDSLGGAWSVMEPCSSGACFERPTCGDFAMKSQQPYLPDEAWNAFVSDFQSPYLEYDDYYVPAPIGHIKFWGLTADYPSATPCVEDPQLVEIVFLDSVGGGHIEDYNVALTGTPVPYAYAPYTIMEYETRLDPPCSILGGYVRIAGVLGSGCDFYWATSPFGNSYSIYENAGLRGVAQWDYAFCLSPQCDPIDSVTIITNAPDVYTMTWYLPQSGYVRVYGSSSPNAVFPNTYSVTAEGFLPAGYFSGYSFYDYDPQRLYVVTNECSAAVPADRSEIGVMHPVIADK
ncbi:MAG: hypothetical protein KDB65_10000 [Calditrichaeota bacterium]|nr:hypothetical protein [Calditrichota bacterium]MCB9369525.1 hypothetical protein [Calditrichota bacterium]